jgi:hypothetical protein
LAAATRRTRNRPQLRRRRHAGQAQAPVHSHGGLPSGADKYSVSLRAGYDAVQKSGQKIEFNEARKITLSRPDKLRVEGERSDGAKTLTVFDGKEITVVDAAANVYATAPQPGSVDQSVVHFVSGLGMRRPLAVLLLSRLPAELEARVQTIDYVEKASAFGARPPPCRAHRHGRFPGMGGRRRQAGSAARGDHVQEISGPTAVLGAVFRLEPGAGDRRLDLHRAGSGGRARKSHSRPSCSARRRRNCQQGPNDEPQILAYCRGGDRGRHFRGGYRR